MSVVRICCVKPDIAKEFVETIRVARTKARKAHEGD